MVQLMPLPLHHLLLHQKSRWIWPFRCDLPRLS